MEHDPTVSGVGGTLTFAGGRRLDVRSAVAADAPDLRALFDSLDDEDRHRRFFCAYHPREPFCLEQVTVAERGGARIVAILSDPASGERRLVAEAGYSLLPTGSGELSVTVTREWRGWLGAYLLDVLCEVAAASHVDAIEADVLTVNQPMLSLLRARGAVVVDHDGYSAIRLRIGTTGAKPDWSGIGRPRLLVEAPGARWHAEAAARAAGIHMIGCSGPRPGRRGCPALGGDPCPLAAGADAIVIAHAPGDASWAALRDAHQRLHPGVPVWVEPADGCGVATLIDHLATTQREDQSPWS